MELVAMDIHPDAVMPSAMRTSSTPTRVDAAQPAGEESAAHLRARLLKMIVENEKARSRPSIEAKPR
jgi:hypothetical protein